MNVEGQMRQLLTLEFPSTQPTEVFVQEQWLPLTAEWIEQALLAREEN